MLMRNIFILLIVLFSFKTFANNPENGKILQFILNDSIINECLYKYELVDSYTFLIIGKADTYLFNNGNVSIIEKTQEFEQTNAIQLKKIKIKGDKAKISFTKSDILVKVTLQRDSNSLPWLIKSRLFCRMFTKKKDRILYWTYEI
jgi:hypothetical protein